MGIAAWFQDGIGGAGGDCKCAAFHLYRILAGPHVELIDHVKVGDADIDQTSQGVRVAGDFDSNWILFLGGTLRYQF